MMIRSKVPAVLGLTALLAACGGSGGSSSSTTPAPPATDGFIILTSDFTTSSLATMPRENPEDVTTIDIDLHGDAVARLKWPVLYVLNRFGADNVQALDIEAGFTTLWQCSVGNGNNPQDLVVVDESQAYVSLYGAGIVRVNLNPKPDCSDFLISEIDLSSVADSDGLAEPDQMALVGDRLWVSVARLTNFSPIENAAVVGIDTETGQIEVLIELGGTNAFGGPKGLPVLEEGSPLLLVSRTGAYGASDGAIEIIDLRTLQAGTNLTTEAQLGGDLTDFVYVSNTRAYAVVSDENFNNSLVRFDPGSGELQAVLTSGPAYLSDIEWDPENQVLLVANQDFTNPGIEIYDTADRRVTTSPIPTGLPPWQIHVP
jgi:WD40 repeat protein